MGKGNLDDLADVHGKLTELFNKALDEGVPTPIQNKETGEVSMVNVPPCAALITQMRQFLKDNGIQADRTRNPGLNALAGKLPSFEPDEYDDGGGRATH